MLHQQLTLLCVYYLHGEAIETARLAAQMLPGPRDVLGALERAIRQVAEYQTACLKAGAFSLWHHDQT
jgi:hypothetical protein